MIWRKEFNEEINTLKGRINNLEKDSVTDKQLVECEICGCLLNKWKAIKGKGEILTRQVPRPNTFYVMGGQVYDQEEYIKSRYYCKIHSKEAL